LASEPDVHGKAAATAAGRLVERYRGKVAAETVRAAFDDAYRALRTEARVHAYLPVLAERAAMRTIDGALRPSPHDSSASPARGPSVTFRGAARQWKSDVHSAADGRWTCVDENADIVVVGCGVDSWAPEEIVIVADPREHPPSHEVATALNQGAAAYVCRADPSLILAHLDALARRPITSGRHHAAAPEDCEGPE